MKQTTLKKTQVNSPYIGLDNLNHAFKFFKENNSKTNIDKKKYNSIAVTFFKLALKHLLSGGEVRLPSGLGVLKIVKRKRDLNNLKPNWKATKDLWSKDDIAKENKKIVYHLNEHSNGFFYRFFWNRGKIKNIRMYCFKPVKAAKRSLASALINDKKDYIG